MKILLVNPPNSGRSIPEERYGITSIKQILRGEPLALEVLAGNLEDFDVRIADADIAVYGFNPEKQDPSKGPEIIRKAFSSAAFVVKGGLPIVRDGEIITEAPAGRTFWLDLPQREGIESEISEFFQKYYSVSFENYPVRESFLHHSAKIPVSTPSE